ncbi:hypothetical protein Lfu02_24900 [Longispora fulva]|uniref:ARB-07466-like C-terminal domain-containing protein n=1 Tax=Longispora fulva TaxID=619741 RepID=A0A8J7GVS1_9ACTN|nr:hypothetical protein [Longispora fulva]MBG6139499.1 hypothetical protein [Longispora fulva]GIG58118.1 hypothetical protein Lfu02_24900 [Longispora fulva]
MSTFTKRILPLALGVALVGGLIAGVAGTSFAQGDSTALSASHSESVADLTADAETDRIAAEALAAAKPVPCPARTTAKMCTLYRAALTASTAGKYKWDSIGCYRQDRLPYHPEGRACDLVYGTIGRRAAGDNLSDGTAMKNWLVKNHTKYKIDHIIWRGVIYSPNGNWKGHPQPNCNSGKITECHYDHVHVAVVR